MSVLSDRTRRRGALLVGIAAVLVVGELTDTGPLLLGNGDAHAVIGRPLTPMSYAGVARRTTRRAYYRGAGGGYYGASYYAPPPVVATPGLVTALPAGCQQVVSNTGVYYACGTAQYAPYYNGSTLVYRPL